MRCFRDRVAERRICGAVTAIVAIYGALWVPSDASAQAVASQSDTLASAPLSTSQSMRLLLEDVNSIHYLRSTIRDEVDWEKFWARMVGDGAHAPMRPPVDFSREMLVLVSNGVTKNYNTIGITKVAVGRDSLVIHVLSRVNVPPGCYYDGAYSPMAIVRVPKSELPARFVEDRIDEECGYTRPLRPPQH
jgi:hypothetical protein